MRNPGVVVLALASALGLAAAPRRIVSISPNVTDILYGVGAFGRVVAVSEYCTYPPAAKSLPRVGGWSAPNLERLAALKPDLVVMTEAQVPFIHEHLRQLGIPTLVTRSQTVADALNAMEAIGGATGNRIQAAALAASTRSALQRVRARAAGLPHPTVLCIVGRTPGTLRDLYAAARGSFLTELIETAGGRVIAAPARAAYGTLNKETIVTLNPDVILDLAPAMKGEMAEDVRASWSVLPELKAVRSGRVYRVEEEFVVHASQMMARTAVLFARLLHPEVPPREWETR